VEESVNRFILILILSLLTGWRCEALSLTSDIAAAIAAGGGVGGGQPPSTMLTNVSAGNGFGLTNLPYAKVLSGGTNGYFVPTVNSDGSTNWSMVLTNLPTGGGSTNGLASTNYVNALEQVLTNRSVFLFYTNTLVNTTTNWTNTLWTYTVPSGVSNVTIDCATVSVSTNFTDTLATLFPYLTYTDIFGVARYQDGSFWGSSNPNMDGFYAVAPEVVVAANSSFGPFYCVSYLYHYVSLPPNYLSVQPGSTITFQLHGYAQAHDGYNYAASARLLTP
jgi:hypothetical protein